MLNCLIIIICFLSLSFSQQGKYHRKSVSSIPIWIKPAALDNKAELTDSFADQYLKSESALSTGIPIEFESQYFDRAKKQFIEVPRFDYNYIPEKLLIEFRKEMDELDHANISDYNVIIPQIIEKTVINGIVKILNDPEIQANRGVELKDESDFQTFAATKAKSFGLTADELKSLMNSAYIYLPYVTKMEEFQQKDPFTQTKVENVKVNFFGGIIWYQILIPPNGNIRIEQISSRVGEGEGLIMVDRHTLEKGVHMLDVPIENIFPGEDRMLCTDDDFVIDDKTDYEYAMYTYTVGGLGPGRIKTADGGCFQLWGIKTTPSQSAQFMALEAFVQNLGVHTKNIDAFKLTAQIMEVDGRKFTFPLGFREGVHMDDGFYIAQLEEDEYGVEHINRFGYSRVIKAANNKTDSNELSTAKRLWGKVNVGDIIVENPSLGNYTHWHITIVKNMRILKDNTYIYSPDIVDFLNDYPEYKDYSVSEIDAAWDDIVWNAEGDSLNYIRPFPAFNSDVTKGIGFMWTMKGNTAPYSGKTQSYGGARTGLIFLPTNSSDFSDNSINIIWPFEMILGRNFGNRFNIGYMAGISLETYFLSGSDAGTSFFSEDKITYMTYMFDFGASLGITANYMVTPNVQISLGCNYKYTIDPYIWLGLYFYDDKPVITSTIRSKYPNFINYQANNFGGISLDIGFSLLKKKSKMRTLQFDSGKIY